MLRPLTKSDRFDPWHWHWRWYVDNSLDRWIFLWYMYKVCAHSKTAETFWKMLRRVSDIFDKLYKFSCCKEINILKFSLTIVKPSKDSVNWAVWLSSDFFWTISYMCVLRFRSLVIVLYMKTLMIDYCSKNVSYKENSVYHSAGK